MWEPPGDIQEGDRATTRRKRFVRDEVIPFSYFCARWDSQRIVLDEASALPGRPVYFPPADGTALRNWMSTLHQASGIDGSGANLFGAQPTRSRWGRTEPFWLPTLGRTFFHPIVDLLFVCGAFSLPFLLLGRLNVLPELGAAGMVAVLIVFNYSHFASSTVRLYTKPGAASNHRFLAYGFPLIALMVTLLAVGFPEQIGRHLAALALTWSPYHYAAQGYGLALMYSYRSGMTFSPAEKRWLFWICMLPFLRALVNIDDTSIAEMMGVRGALWLLPESVISDGGIVAAGLRKITAGLTPLVFVLPVAYACFGRSRLPLVALVLVLVNALWLTAFSLFDAIVWATVAHSVQYLFIVTYTHARETAAERGPRHHLLRFYGLSLLTGAGLFFALPAVISRSGHAFGQQWDPLHCYLMVAAAINVHHFIVDGYIWRSKPAPTAAAA